MFLAPIGSGDEQSSLAGVSMFVGTLIFSGCLYALALTGQTFIGAIVPVGGVLFVVGWILLALAGGGLVESQDKKLTAREKLLRGTKPKSDELAAEEPAAEESAAQAD